MMDRVPIPLGFRSNLGELSNSVNGYHAVWNAAVLNQRRYYAPIEQRQIAQNEISTHTRVFMPLVFFLRDNPTHPPIPLLYYWPRRPLGREHTRTTRPGHESRGDEISKMFLVNTGRSINQHQ